MLTADLDIEIDRTGPAAGVWLSGELDMATAPLLVSRLTGLVALGVVDFTVDLARLDFIDSSGLKALVSVLRAVGEHGGSLVLRAPTPFTRKVFEITGLTSVFTIVPAHQPLGQALPLEPPGSDWRSE